MKKLNETFKRQPKRRSLPVPKLLTWKSNPVGAMVRFLIKNISSLLVIIAFIILIAYNFRHYFVDPSSVHVYPSADIVNVRFNINQNCTVSFVSDFEDPDLSIVTWSAHDDGVDNGTLTFTITDQFWGLNRCNMVIKDSFPPTRIYTFHCSGECNFTNTAQQNDTNTRPKLNILIYAVSSSIDLSDMDFHQLYLNIDIGILNLINTTIDNAAFLVNYFDMRIVTDAPTPALVHQIQSNFYIYAPANYTTSTLQVNPCINASYCPPTTGVAPNQGGRNWTDKDSLVKEIQSSIQSSTQLLSDAYVNDQYLSWRYYPVNTNVTIPLQVVMLNSRLMLVDRDTYLQQGLGNPTYVKNYVTLDQWNFPTLLISLVYLSPDVANITLQGGYIYGSSMSQNHQYIDYFVSRYIRNFFEYGRQHYSLFVNFLPWNVSFVFTAATNAQIIQDRINLMHKIFNSNMDMIYIRLPVLGLSYSRENDFFCMMQSVERILNQLANHPPATTFVSAVRPAGTPFVDFAQRNGWFFGAYRGNNSDLINQWFQIQLTPSNSYTFWPLGFVNDGYETVVGVGIVAMASFFLLLFISMHVIKAIELMEYSNKIKYIRSDNKDLRLLRSQMDDLSQNKMVLFLRIIFNTNYNELLMCYYYFYHSRFENAIKSFGRHFFEKVDVSKRNLLESAPVYRKNVPLEEFKTIYERYCFLNDLEIKDPLSSEAREMFDSYDYQLTPTNQGQVMVENLVVFDNLHLNELETDSNDCADSLDMFYKYNCRIYPKRNTPFDDFVRIYKKFCETYRLHELDFSQEFLSAKYGLKFILREIVVLEPKLPKPGARYTYYIRPITWELNNRKSIHLISVSLLYKISSLRILAFRSLYYLVIDVLFFQNILVNISYLFFASDDFFNNYLNWFASPFPPFVTSNYYNLVMWCLLLMVLLHRLTVSEFTFQVPILTQGALGIVCTTVFWCAIYYQKLVQFTVISYYLVLILRSWSTFTFNLLNNDLFSVLALICLGLLVLIVVVNNVKIWHFGKIIERRLIKSISDSIRADVTTRNPSVQLKEKEAGWALELEEFFNLFQVCQQVVNNRSLLSHKQLQLLTNNIMKNLGFEFKTKTLNLAVDLNVKRLEKQQRLVGLNRFFFAAVKDFTDTSVESSPAAKTLKRIFTLLQYQQFTGRPIISAELLKELAGPIATPQLATYAKQFTSILNAVAIDPVKNRTIQKSHKFQELDLLTMEFLSLFRRLLNLSSEVTEIRINGHTTERALNPIKIGRIFAREFSGVHDYELFCRLMEFKLNHFFETTYLLDKDPVKLGDTLMEWVNMSGTLNAKTIVRETITNLVSFDSFRINWLQNPKALEARTNRQTLESQFHEFLVILHLCQEEKYLPLLHSRHDLIRSNLFYRASAANMGMTINEFLAMTLCINGVHSPYNLEFIDFLCRTHGFAAYGKFCSFVYVLLNYEDLEQVWVLAEFLPPKILKLFVYLSDPEATITTQELDDLVAEASIRDNSKKADLRRLIRDRLVVPLLEFKALMGEVASFSVSWTMMELVFDSVNKQRDRNTFMNSLMKAFVHLMADKSLSLFLEEFVKLIFRVQKQEVQKLTTKKRFRLWQFIFPKKAADFSQFEIHFQPNLMYDKKPLANDARRGGVDSWTLKRFPKMDKNYKRKIETEFMLLNRTSQSLVDYTRSLRNLFNEEDAEISELFLRNNILGIRRFTYAEARRLLEIGFGNFWRKSLLKEPGDVLPPPETSSPKSSQKVLASEGFDDLPENEPLLFDPEDQETQFQLEPVPEKKLSRPIEANVVVQRIGNSKIFEFLQSMAKSSLTRDPIPLISFYQRFYTRHMFMSFLVRRYFQWRNSQRLTDDAFLFASLRNLAPAQAAILNTFFVLSHETYDNREAVDTLLAVFNFDKHLLDAILYLKRKRFSLAKAVAALARKKSRLQKNDFVVREVSKTNAVSLVFHPSFTDFTLDRFHGVKDALYYLIKAKQVKGYLQRNFDRLSYGDIRGLFKKNSMRILMDYFKLDPKEFEALLILATNTFRDLEVEAVCRIAGVSPQDKLVTKNIAYLKRKLSYNKSNHYFGDLLGNSEWLKLAEIPPLPGWLYALSVKRDYYNFFKLLKSNMVMFHEVFGLKEVLYGSFFVLSPKIPGEDGRIKDLKVPKLVNHQAYYQVKLERMESPMTRFICRPPEAAFHEYMADSKDFGLPWMATQLILYNLVKSRQGETSQLDMPLLRLVLRRCLLSVLKRTSKFQSLYTNAPAKTVPVDSSQAQVNPRMSDFLEVERRNINSNFIKFHQSNFTFNLNEGGFIRFVKNALRGDKLGPSDTLPTHSFNRHLLFLFFRKMQREHKSSKLLDNLHLKLKDPEYCCWSHRIDMLSPNCLANLFLEEKHYVRFKSQIFEYLFKLSKDIENPVRYDAETQTASEKADLLRRYYDQRHAFLSALYSLLMRKLMNFRPMFSETLLLAGSQISFDKFNTSSFQFVELLQVCLASFDIHTFAFSGRVWTPPQKRVLAKILEIVTLNLVGADRMVVQREAEKYQEIMAQLHADNGLKTSYLMAVLGYFMELLPLSEEIAMPVSPVFPADEEMEDKTPFQAFAAQNLIDREAAGRTIQAFLLECAPLNEHATRIAQAILQENYSIRVSDPAKTEPDRALDTDSIDTIEALMNLRNSKDPFLTTNLKSRLGTHCKSNSINLVDFLRFLVHGYEDGMFGGIAELSHLTLPGFRIILGDADDFPAWLQIKIDQKAVSKQLKNELTVLFQASYAQDRRRDLANFPGQTYTDIIEAERIDSNAVKAFKRLGLLFHQGDTDSRAVEFLGLLYELAFGSRENTLNSLTSLMGIIPESFIDNSQMNLTYSLIEFCSYVLQANFDGFGDLSDNHLVAIYRHFEIENIENLRVFPFLNSLFTGETQLENIEDAFYKCISFGGYDLLNVELEECRRFVFFVKHLMSGDFRTGAVLLRNSENRKAYAYFVASRFFLLRHRLASLEAKYPELTDFFSDIYAYIFLHLLIMNVEMRRKLNLENLDGGLISREFRVVEEVINSFEMNKLIRFDRILMEEGVDATDDAMGRAKEPKVDLQIQNFSTEVRKLYYLFIKSVSFFTEKSSLVKGDEAKIIEMVRLQSLLLVPQPLDNPELRKSMEALFGSSTGLAQKCLQIALEEKALLDTGFLKWGNKLYFADILARVQRIDTPMDSARDPSWPIVKSSLELAVQLHFERNWSRRLTLLLNFMYDVGFLNQHLHNLFATALSGVDVPHAVECLYRLFHLAASSANLMQDEKPYLAELFNALSISPQEQDTFFTICQILTGEKSYFNCIISKEPLAELSIFVETRKKYQQMVWRNIFFVSSLFFSYKEIDKRMFHENKRTIEARLPKNQHLYNGLLFQFYELMGHKSSQHVRYLKQFLITVYGVDLMTEYRVRSILKKMKMFKQIQSTVVSKEYFEILHMEVFRQVVATELLAVREKKRLGLPLLVAEMVFGVICFAVLLVKRFAFAKLPFEDYLVYNWFTVGFIFGSIIILLIRKLFLFLQA